VATTVPTFVTQAEGARLRDADGNEFIDFAAGIGVVNVGLVCCHRHQACEGQGNGPDDKGSLADGESRAGGTERPAARHDDPR